MPHPWLSALPYHLAASMLRYPDISPLERVEQTAAVGLFADISGFTPMSEALGAHGPSGTEELSDILNRYFAAMIARIHHFGGSVGKIAGDALLAIFPCHPRTRQVMLRRALQCALDMQELLPHAQGVSTRAGRFPLTMKVGIGIGNVRTSTVGLPRARLEYLLAGSAIDQCIAAEQHTPKGAVVVGEVLAPLLGQALTQPVAPGYQQVVRLLRRPRPLPNPPLPEPPPAIIEMFGSYLPASIAQRLAAAQSALVDEHRTITVAFVRFAGIDPQSPTAYIRLQGYLAEVIGVIQRYEGYLRQIEVGDKGNLFIAVFGAPQAHEDDAERAVRCVLELRDLSSRLGINTQTGVATGKVFCGLIGSAERLDYAAIGDTVNTAARVMSAAQAEQILLTETTRQLLHSAFSWVELPPLTVKGKQEPLRVVALNQRTRRSRSRLRAPSYRLPMVGRTAELALGKQVLSQVINGRGQYLSITAEAGMGKSRLVTELLRYASSQPIHYYTSECLSYAMTSSYLVWQNLLRPLFGLTPKLDREQSEQQIRAQLALVDATLIDRLPLLNVVLGTMFPETEWTRSLGAKLRKSALEVLVVACLRFWAQQQPLLLVLEDCHWIDELSFDLLLTIAERLDELPILLVVTMRPNQQMTLQAGLQRLRMLPWFHAVSLYEFTATEAEHLIALKLGQLFGGKQAAPELVARLQERAQGNPFYLDELVNLLHDRNVDIHDLSVLTRVELPETLQRLILSRIDQLAEGPKLVLKVASVVGRLFKAHWLSAIYPPLGVAEAVLTHLETLHQQELTQLERHDPEVEYLFKHLLTREVAYESLAHSTRGLLHEQVGSYIEVTYAEELDRYIDLLAYHYGLSPNVEKQRLYFLRAAQSAAAAFANMAAIGYYERVLPLLGGIELVDAYLDLCQVRTLVGQWELADRDGRMALALAQSVGDVARQARCYYVLGHNLSYSGFWVEAVPDLEQARRLAEASGDRRTLGRAVKQIAGAYYTRGLFTQALACNEESLRIAIAEGDDITRCECLNNIGVLHDSLGNYRTALEWYEQGVLAATAINEQHWLGGLLLNTMMTYTQLGDYVQAMAYGRRSLQIAYSLGIVHLIQIVLINIGRLYIQMGMYEQALLCMQGGILLERGMSSPRSLGLGLCQAATCYIKLGDLASGDRLFLAGLAVCRAFNQATSLMGFCHTYAQSLVDQQRYVEAQEVNDEALALVAQVELNNAGLPLRLLALRLQVVRGQLPPSQAIAQLDALRQDWTAEEQQAAITYTTWQIDPTREDARNEAVSRYRVLYARTPKIEYRERYLELTGEHLPEPPPLPDLPPQLDRTVVPIKVLLDRASALLAEQQRISGQALGM